MYYQKLKPLLNLFQVNGQAMIGITHEHAVSVLKSIQDTAHLKVEKNAIGASGHLTSTDEEEDMVSLYLVCGAGCFK